MLCAFRADCRRGSLGGVSHKERKEISPSVQESVRCGPNVK